MIAIGKVSGANVLVRNGAVVLTPERESYQGWEFRHRIGHGYSDDGTEFAIEVVSTGASVPVLRITRWDRVGQKTVQELMPHELEVLTRQVVTR